MRATLLAAAFAALSSAAAEAAILTAANNNERGPGSLWAAVAASAHGDLTFDPVVKNTIVLASGQIAITRALTITGPGPAKHTAAELSIRATRWRH